MPGGNLSMQHMNPNGYLAVLGSDERRKEGRDARRCDDWGADGVMEQTRGIRSFDASDPGCGSECF